MRQQSEEALAASEFQRRSRLKGVKFAVVSGVLENGEVIADLVLVHRPNGTFKSPGVEEQNEWNRRYPNGLDYVPAAPRAR